MAVVNEFKCADCGVELADDGRVFVWDCDSHQTRDFLILMSTYMQLDSAKISGGVSETYCSGCDKFLKIYSIKKFSDDVENPCETVRRGIENYISEYGCELQKLKDIKKRSDYTIEKENDYYVIKIPEYENFYYSNYLFPQMSKEEVIQDALNDFHKEIDEVIESRQEKYQRYLNSNYLIVDDSDREFDDYDALEKVNCPECGREIFKYVNGEVPCPKCGGHLFCISSICYD